MFNNSVKFGCIHVNEVIKGNKRVKKAETLDINLILNESWSFRDPKLKPWIPPNEKKIFGLYPKQLRPGIQKRLATTYSCLSNTVW